MIEASSRTYLRRNDLGWIKSSGLKETATNVQSDLTETLNAIAKQRYQYRTKKGKTGMGTDADSHSHSGPICERKCKSCACICKRQTQKKGSNAIANVQWPDQDTEMNCNWSMISDWDSNTVCRFKFRFRFRFQARLESDNYSNCNVTTGVRNSTWWQAARADLSTDASTCSSARISQMQLSQSACSTLNSALRALQTRNHSFHQHFDRVPNVMIR